MDVTRPSIARMYDYFLGGTDHYRSDRDACRQLLALVPNSRELARVNRAFLARAVRFLANAGVRQFLDHGSGLPTEENVHQVAQGVAPSSRVVYVDNDPLVLAHGRLRLETNANTAVIGADLRRTSEILESPECTRLIDLTQPLGALFVSVLQCVPDGDDPRCLIRWFAENLPAGSFLVVCQLVSDDDDRAGRLDEFMQRTVPGAWGRVRSPEDVRGYFDSPRLRIVDDLCEVSRWRPDHEVGPRPGSPEWVVFGGVAQVV